MPDEIPEADAYHLQYQHAGAKDSGAWRDHKVTPHKSVAEDFLDSSPENCASRVVPMEAFPGEAVVVTGTTYDHPTAGEHKAAAL